MRRARWRFGALACAFQPPYLRYTLFIDEENAARRAKKVAKELPTLPEWAKNDRHAKEASPSSASARIGLDDRGLGERQLARWGR